MFYLGTTVMMLKLQKKQRWPAGSKQIMAVDVLTGKSKKMQADRTLCSPPKIEDESVGM